MIPARETERLLIRDFKGEDWRNLRALILKYHTSGYAVYDHQWPSSEDEIKSVANWFASGDSYFAVCLKETRELVGFVALNGAGDGVYNLGYVFDPDHHQRGYATEACRVILERAFTELNADRVVSGTAAANVPSSRLLRRLGMRQTGGHTASFRAETEFAGLTFAISREEWRGTAAQR